MAGWAGAVQRSEQLSGGCGPPTHASWVHKECFPVCEVELPVEVSVEEPCQLCASVCFILSLLLSQISYGAFSFSVHLMLLFSGALWGMDADPVLPAHLLPCPHLPPELLNTCHLKRKAELLFLNIVTFVLEVHVVLRDFSSPGLAPCWVCNLFTCFVSSPTGSGLSLERKRRLFVRLFSLSFADHMT